MIQKRIGMIFDREQFNVIFCIFLFLTPSLLDASCPDVTPWTVPVALSSGGNVTSGVFSAGTAAGFMAVWADSTNNAHYSFSADGITWQSGDITSATGDVASSSDIFVAGNATGFIVTWMDSSNNAWSSFSANNGASWSDALQINGTLSLNAHSDVHVGGSSSGFVAAMIGADNNAYVSFSNGTVWSTPVQVTSDGSVYDQNWNSQTTRGFVYATVVGNSCMITWIANTFPTYSAYFSSINPFSSTTPNPIAAIGFFESVPVTAQLNGYFMSATRANEGEGVTVFATATNTSNWAIFSLFSSPNNPDAGPWVASNPTGFMSSWVIGADESSPGSPVWTFSANNGFNWTPVCPILLTESTTITAPVGLSANTTGFIATWPDTNDSNAYASFYATPAPTPPAAGQNIWRKINALEVYLGCC